MLSSSSITFLAIQIVFSIIFPVILLLVWKHKTKESLFPALTGALVFLIFAIALENVLHTFCLVLDNPLSKTIKSNPWFLTLYGAFAAGIFEETGRFVAFKTLLRKRINKQTAITYGIGHGGFECIFLLGIVGISNLVLTLTYGSFTQGELISKGLQDLIPALNNINSLNAFTVAIGCFERVIAVTLQIALSVFVFTAARSKGKLWMYPLAVVLHIAVDIFPGLYKSGIISSMLVLELIILAYTVIVGIFAFILYKNTKTDSLTKQESLA